MKYLLLLFRLLAASFLPVVPCWPISLVTIWLLRFCALSRAKRGQCRLPLAVLVVRRGGCRRAPKHRGAARRRRRPAAAWPALGSRGRRPWRQTRAPVRAMTHAAHPRRMSTLCHRRLFVIGGSRRLAARSGAMASSIGILMAAGGGRYDRRRVTLHPLHCCNGDDERRRQKPSDGAASCNHPGRVSSRASHHDLFNGLAYCRLCGGVSS